MSKNWTEKNTESFLSRITFDFIAQLEQKMESLPLTQAELAKKLGVTDGFVSQILNNPSNLSLKTIIKYARALGLKVAVVAYDDDDPDNTRGLVNSEIFSICWEKQGKPVDYFSLEEPTQQNNAEITNIRTSDKFASKPIEQVASGHFSVDYIREVKPRVIKVKPEAGNFNNEISAVEGQPYANTITLEKAA
jgi:transcriptional regulator with XRE-family HTH domain